MLRSAAYLLLALIAVQYFHVTVAKAADSCPQRTEPNHRCRRKCASNDDCKTKSKKRKKICSCDGECGMSCIRTSQRCREDRTLVTDLKKGKIFLNGKPFAKKRYNVGDVVSFTCKDGFQLSGPAKFTCSGIGKWKPWDQGRPSCRKECKRPDNFKDGRILGDSFEVGKRVRFRCNPGYVLKGSTFAVCMRNMKWNNPPPKCTVLACNDPKIPENAHIYRGKQDTYQYGDRVYMRCDQGYSRIGSPLIICDFDGWKARGSSFRCAAKSCGSPGRLSNGKVEGTVYTYKSVVKFSCNPGYKLRGAPYRRCYHNQKWTGSVPICERVDCGEPIPIENGKYDRYGTKFMDKYFVSCNEGFVLSGSKEITCLSTENWSEKPQCSLVTCDSSYAIIQHGNVKGENAGKKCSATYNCLLTYECDNGYRIDNANYKRMVCQINGQWSKPKPSCKPIYCGLPSAPKYGQLTFESRDFYFPSVVQYVCYHGYDMVGSSSRKCLAEERWEGRPPTCIANCGDPGTPANGRRFGERFKGDDKIKFECNVGYDLIGEEEINCQQSSAKWTNDIPECRPKSCGDPRPITGGRVLSSEFVYPAVLKYECLANYEMVGRDEITCQADGKWNRQSKCIANCGDPGTPANGRRLSDRFKGDDKIKFECNVGYDLIGDEEISCQQSSAKWTNDIPTCRPKSCGDPRPITGGRVLSGAFDYPAVLKYECLANYEMVGRDEVTCQADGKWNRLPKCIANCGDPGTSANGRRLGDRFKGDDKIKFECNVGYDLIGEEEISCQQSSAKWTNDIPECRPKSCGDPRPITGGRVLSGAFDYPAVLKYECLANYEMVGRDEVTCQADGKWDRQPKCIANCGNPGKIVNGFVSGRIFKAEDIVTYSCHEGYQLVGAAESTCDQATAKWLPAKPSCEELTCPASKVPRDRMEIDASKVLLADKGGAHKIGSEITYTCSDGFEMIGESIRRCGRNGWSAKEPRCRVLSCTRPNIENANLKMSPSSYITGDNITVVCDDGYELSGTSVLTCGEDGKWGNLPQCKETIKDLKGSCNRALGMENGKILDRQITASSTYKNYDVTARRNGKVWCGEYIDKDDEVSIKIKFPSVMTITAVLLHYQWNHLQAKLVSFRYLHPETRVVREEEKKFNTLRNRSTSEIKVILDRPIQTSNFEIVFQRNKYGFVCENFELFGCDLTKCLRPNITNAKLKSWQSTYNQGYNLTVECNDGYELTGISIVTCGKDRMWGRLPKCQEITGKKLSIVRDKKLKVPDVSCDEPLGMENGRILDDQIRVQSRYNSGYSKTARFNGRTWCADYIGGKISIEFQFSSVVRITGVLLQYTWPEYQARQTSFRYLDSVKEEKIFNDTRIYRTARDKKNVIKVLLDDPMQTSYFQIILHKEDYPYVCERFELLGCKVDSTCKTPKRPANGEAIGMLYTEGDNAFYSCREGYKLRYNERRQCKADGTWSGSIPTCIQDDAYIGCHNTNDQSKIGDGYDPERCIKDCYRFSYALLQYSNCFCRNYLDKTQEAAFNHCRLPCGYGSSRRCGGPNAKSVYRVR